MSLQLVIGSSGYGKSTYIYDDVIKKSIKYPDRNYIVVVPEQYTMETQKKLVMSHPDKGILNIDVVSFERLAYKVFEEVGEENGAVIDDTGKNLIIRHVLEECKGSLSFFGNSINKMGFVSELKSVVSELLQYDIKPDGLKLIRESESIRGNRQLYAKLQDISLVYDRFKEYLSNNYITSEEILDVLCTVIDKSQLIKDSEIIFDGFTGFTPIQYKLMRLFLIKCSRVCVSVTADTRENINVYDGMQNLFFMSKDMVLRLHRICDEEHIEVERDIILDNVSVSRFSQSQELGFLEKNLFRYNYKKYEDDVKNIKLFAASTPKEELQYAISQIIVLTRKQGYRYKDIAIVSGDMAEFGTMAGNMLAQNDIPFFVDQKKSVTDNPFVELIRSAIEIVEKGFSYDSIIRYLRTGMTDIDRNGIDMLDNYCLAMGIRGRKAWFNEWKKKSRRKNDIYNYEQLENYRIIITEPLIKLDIALREKTATVKDYVRALYEFIVELDCQEKIYNLSKEPDAGNEYGQLYKKVMILFDKMVELLGDEHVSVKEFADIIDAGFDEIKVGLIPPSADCIVVGDIERTRLDNIKVLFFVGMNDGIVPKRNDNKGILSETDRDILENNNVTLSPSAREKAFVQKFYLYLIMTKANERLIITFAKKDNQGKSLLPSYILRNLKLMYPKLKTDEWDEDTEEKKYIRIPKAQIEWSEENYIKALGENIVNEMYGDNISGSVSAFERFAACQFAYYLQYGLRLEEREEYSFKVSDFGTVLHAVIEDVSKELKKNKKSFSLISDDERYHMVEESMGRITQEYGNTILKDSSRNEYLIDRMTKLADRTIWAIGKQLECGIFKPDAYEMKFLLDGEVVESKKTLSMKGKIDRIDICEDDNNIYVRIVDYKSGKSDFDLLRTYYGLKLQLIMYMKAAKHIEQLRNNGKNIIPAGVLYFNMDNPIIDMTADGGDFSALDEDEQKEQIDIKVQEALRMKGIVNDNVDIIKKMDDTTGKSLNIPIAFKKDGQTLDLSKSSIMNTTQFDMLESFVSEKTIDMTRQIFDGQININPYKQGTKNACEYCEFSAVCGFSTDLDNSSYNFLRKFKDEELWNKIKAEVEKDGRQLDIRTEESD